MHGQHVGYLSMRSKKQNRAATASESSLPTLEEGRKAETKRQNSKRRADTRIQARRNAHHGAQQEVLGATALGIPCLGATLVLAEPIRSGPPPGQ
ncbi:hypothetical protein AVEN_45872-1 [Araneus ventricosus]|uniref:Uncharacterized protein n=1 Tax=Araneus ventricosus TaxID=182803 RepID=A0A4Y2SBU2_ARAVE|nr:hypothetical protein AVEN_45872-1 [Araneus ventricosus]